MTTRTDLYPYLLEPAYKDYIWGGSRIPALFHRDQPAGIYAESWELSDRPEGMTCVANGPLKGLTLAALVAQQGCALLGKKAGAADRFPLLVKLIDARERLSIQVHPDDETAARGLGEAKTEAWHILEAPASGHVFAGLKPGLTEQGFLDALASQELEATLQRIPVIPGDTVFIPGGRVHAIAEGLLILEVQQNSNTTYRVYDWGRVDKQGKSRELHVEQARKVIRWADDCPVVTQPRTLLDKQGTRITELVACPYFRLEQLDLPAPHFVHHEGGSFHLLFSAQDEVKIMSESGTEAVPSGHSCLIPAALDRYTIKPSGRHARLLRISVPC